jgi:hypothetical protein
MEQSSKRLRFISFLDEALNKSAMEINSKIIFSNVDHFLTLKIKVRDIGFTRFITFYNNEFVISDKSEKKIDCTIIFESAKVLHQMLIGRVLPYHSSLIGKFEIIFFTEKGKVLTSIFNPAKNNYSKIIKGTRFTLKKEPISNKI